MGEEVSLLLRLYFRHLAHCQNVLLRLCLNRKNRNSGLPISAVTTPTGRLPGTDLTMMSLMIIIKAPINADDGIRVLLLFPTNSLAICGASV